ncbi:SH3 domain-binding glutamic acid-rich protein homolog [Anthonomus grandis grandis]|uniref:SH3 domain-binding glutamic acid-rich protein homolog n=1 Tax=Anthonomus grandis grandis TaxID=2921223 RepID=UPI00216625E7|nr:SH3 domain-binding glutamic acid-rich protein homolog [Anthonomus grandis grandis]
MVVKVYISGISGNKEVKKRQQRVQLILDSKNINYELLDIAEPNMEDAKEYMQNNSKMMGGTISDPNPRHPLPPQIFNDDEYCGDYDAFDMANEMDEMEKFLKLSPEEQPEAKVINGETKSKEATPEQNGDVGDENAVKEKSPSPEKKESSPPAVDGVGENATDDQKVAENDENQTVEETEKSEEA